MICLGFIERPQSESSTKVVTSDYVLSKEAKYQIDIAGYRFKALPYLHAPVLNSQSTRSSRYRPTVVSNVSR